MVFVCVGFVWGHCLDPVWMLYDLFSSYQVANSRCLGLQNKPKVVYQMRYPMGCPLGLPGKPLHLLNNLVAHRFVVGMTVSSMR